MKRCRGLPVHPQPQQWTLSTLPVTLFQLCAEAVALTVVPYRACSVPDIRALAIERTLTKAPVECVPHVVQASRLPLSELPEKAQTLPCGQAPIASRRRSSGTVSVIAYSGQCAVCELITIPPGTRFTASTI